MLFNKNEVRKASEKKVLHKSGKNWIVLSSALLLALAGGAAVSSQTSANADNNNQADVQQDEQNFLTNVDNNSAINSNNNSTIHSLVGNSLVNAPASSAASKASAKSTSSASSQWYWKWNGGSAASYHAEASSDVNIASNENKIVNSYVKSVNAQFPSETSSLNASLGAAQSKLGDDKSLAASYSATANASDYSSEVNSLAASAGMTNSAYIESVEYRASNYSSTVKSDSTLNSEMTSVNSYADILDSIANGNDATKSAYREAAISANDSAANAKLVYSNAVNNLNAYNSNVANSKALTLAERIALNDSVEDAGFVQSIANALHTNSNVISSEVRSYATSANEVGVYNGSIGNYNILSASSSDAINSFQASHYLTNTSDFTGTDGNPYVYMTFTQLNNTTSVANPNGTTYDGIEFSAANNGSYEYLDHVDPALVRVVSNTSVMYSYDAAHAAYGKNVAKYSAASSAVNSASVAYNDAETTANYYDILNDATNSDADYALNYIFGTNGVNVHLMKSDTDNGDNAGSAAFNLVNYRDGYFTSNSDVSVKVPVIKGYNDSSAASAYNVADTVVSVANSALVNGDNVSTVVSAIGSADNNGLLASLASNVAKSGGSLGSDANEGSLMSSASSAFNSQMSSAGHSGMSSVASAVTAAIKAVAGAHSDDATSAMSSAAISASTAGETAVAIINAAHDAIRASATNSDVVNAVLKAANDETSAYKAAIKAYAANGKITTATASSEVEVPNYKLSTLSGINSDTSSVANAYTIESNASVAYANTTDANIALAPYYAASYAGDLKGDQESVNNASNAQQSFYAAHAGSSYASAQYQASSAASAATNDEALGDAYAINVYNVYAPKYIRAIRGVRVHTDTNFGDKGDKVIGTIPAGDEMTVEGIGLDAHGALRYNIYFKGNNYFVSGNNNYVKATFLPAANNVSIVVNKPAKVYADKNFTKPVGKLAANAQIDGDVIRMDNFNNGFTRVRLSNGNYTTANTNYVALVANNDDIQNNINGQSINHYIANANNTNNNNADPITWGI